MHIKVATPEYSMQTHRHRFEKVEDYLHHRPPYLLVETIESIEDGMIKTSKTVSDSDKFLDGHFPGAPVFPGAMMQELVTQSAGILLAANYNPMKSYDTSDPNHNEYALGVLVRVKRARYKGFARPGDKLDVSVELKNQAGTLFDFAGRIEVNNREIMRVDFQLSNISSKVLTES